MINMEKKLVFGAINSIIPADGSVTTIGDSAFYGRNDINAIVIPTAITTIEVYGLNLNGSIGTIYYEGTEEQWNAIDIGENNADVLDATKVYNAVTATFVTWAKLCSVYPSAMRDASARRIYSRMDSILVNS